MNQLKITKITGTAVPLRGDDVDTDRIIPARFLRCVTFDGLGEHAFEDDRQQDPTHPFNQARFRGASILLAGRNFGCGSSREHAPQALHKWGIKTVVAQSFAEIFFGNCQAMGMPCFVVKADDGERLFAIVERDPATTLTLDVASATITVNGQSYTASIPDGVRQAFLSGSWNATGVLLSASADVDAIAKRLPYVNNFAA